MDAIETLINDFKNKKINDDQLQSELASLLQSSPDDHRSSKKSLTRQLSELRKDNALAEKAYDNIKTIVSDSFLAESNQNTKSASSDKSVMPEQSGQADQTVVVDPNVTRVVTDTITNETDQTIVANTQSKAASSAQTIVNRTQNLTSDTAQTIVNHTQDITSDTAQTIVSAATKGLKNTKSDHTNNYFDQISGTQVSDLKPGSILKNRFILEHELGHGGMSIVYRALDLRKQEANNRNPHIAVKILGEAFKNHPQSIRVLEHETQKIQSLAHPNIITVYDFDRDGDAIYMTMECLEGESLDNLIHDNEMGFDIAQSLPVIEGVSRALAYAHSKNIIHSDLKPENIFLTNDKVVKVLDFGIARAKKLPEQKDTSNADFDGSNLGALTPPYASPEMFENADPDPRDDIYALGCVTYKLLTGSHPFADKQANHARDQNLVPQKIPTLSRKQWMTLSKSLAFEREQRVATITEFLNGMIPKKRSMWFYAGLTGTIVAMGVSGYAWYAASQKPLLPQFNLTVEQKQKISDYAETAQLYLSMGYLASPPGDSAFDQYQKILTIDPTNQAAIEGKKQIAEQYATFAEEKFSKDEIEESIQLLKTGLLVEPENKRLLALQLQIHENQTQ